MLKDTPGSGGVRRSVVFEQHVIFSAFFLNSYFNFLFLLFSTFLFQFISIFDALIVFLCSSENVRGFSASNVAAEFWIYSAQTK